MNEYLEARIKQLQSKHKETGEIKYLHKYRELQLFKRRCFAPVKFEHVAYGYVKDENGEVHLGVIPKENNHD